MGTDGNPKMGKSLNNTIYLSDSTEEVEKRVMNMFTDPKRIHPTDPGTIAGNPVFTYLDSFAKEKDKGKIDEYKDRYEKGEVGDVEVKKYLAQVLNNFLNPIRERRLEYESQPEVLDKILVEGTAKTKKVASETLSEVRSEMGLI